LNDAKFPKPSASTEVAVYCRQYQGECHGTVSVPVGIAGDVMLDNRLLLNDFQKLARDSHELTTHGFDEVSASPVSVPQPTILFDLSLCSDAFAPKIPVFG
jgi:hypothetical protein